MDTAATTETPTTTMPTTDALVSVMQVGLEATAVQTSAVPMQHAAVMEPHQTRTRWMAARALAVLDGVEAIAPRTSLARMMTAAMAPQLIQTNWMAALAAAHLDGVVTLATETSVARLVIAMTTAPLRT